MPVHILDDGSRKAAPCSSPCPYWLKPCEGAPETHRWSGSSIAKEFSSFPFRNRRPDVPVAYWALQNCRPQKRWTPSLLQQLSRAALPTSSRAILDNFVHSPASPPISSNCVQSCNVPVWTV